MDFQAGEFSPASPEEQVPRGAGRKLDFTRPFPSLRAMSKLPGKQKQSPPTLILGVGLDSDGHKRLTTGPNFALVGGSQATHDEMTEKAIKINEKLIAKGKPLHQVTREEFDDIAEEVGLRRRRPQRN